MKNHSGIFYICLMLKNLLLTILLFSGFNAFSQAHFEGIVTYEMQLADRNSADVSDETGGSDHLIPKERSEEHTSELQSLMRISYAVFCLKKKTKHKQSNKKYYQY